MGAMVVFVVVIVWSYIAFKNGENSMHASTNRSKAIQKGSKVYHDDYGKEYLTGNGHKSVSYLNEFDELITKDLKTGREYGNGSRRIKEIKREVDNIQNSKRRSEDSIRIKESANPASLFFGFPEPGLIYKAVFSVHDGGYIALKGTLWIRSHSPQSAMYFWIRLKTGEVFLRNPWSRNETLLSGLNHHIPRERNYTPYVVYVVGNVVSDIANRFLAPLTSRIDEYKYYNGYPRSALILASQTKATEWLHQLEIAWDTFGYWLEISGVREKILKYYETLSEQCSLNVENGCEFSAENELSENVKISLNELLDLVDDKINLNVDKRVPQVYTCTHIEYK